MDLLEDLKRAVVPRRPRGQLRTGPLFNHATRTEHSASPPADDDEEEEEEGSGRCCVTQSSGTLVGTGR